MSVLWCLCFYRLMCPATDTSSLSFLNLFGSSSLAWHLPHLPGEKQSYGSFLVLALWESRYEAALRYLNPGLYGSPTERPSYRSPRRCRPPATLEHRGLAPPAVGDGQARTRSIPAGWLEKSALRIRHGSTVVVGLYITYTARTTTTAPTTAPDALSRSPR
jgi:hypothetical protein